jgi:2-oxo-4-hydroxy-4-carboxy-5-ureidoimidazoline decarboxylase
VNSVLERWNRLSLDAAAGEILPCCGSRGWAEGLSKRRPLDSEVSLLATSDKVWNGLSEKDWGEAFRSHPRIGDAKVPKEATPQSAAWSGEEQRTIADASEAAGRALAEGNREYENRFNRTFIVCATGKSPQDILDILQRRIGNDDFAELLEAAEQQRQITHIRLKKWLLAEGS